MRIVHLLLVVMLPLACQVILASKSTHYELVLLETGPELAELITDPDSKYIEVELKHGVLTLGGWNELVVREKKQLDNLYVSLELYLVFSDQTLSLQDQVPVPGFIGAMSFNFENMQLLVSGVGGWWQSLYQISRVKRNSILYAYDTSGSHRM